MYVKGRISCVVRRREEVIMFHRDGCDLNIRYSYSFMILKTSHMIFADRRIMNKKLKVAFRKVFASIYN